MPTATEITNAMEDKVLESVRASQRAVVDSVRSWASTVETAFSRLPELNFTESPVVKPTEAFEHALNFSEKLVATQREFAAQVLEAAVPVAKAGANSVSQAAKQNTTAVK